MKHDLCVGLLCSIVLVAPPAIAGHAHDIRTAAAAADEANPNTPKKTNANMNANVHAGSSNAAVTGGEALDQNRHSNKTGSHPTPGAGGGGGDATGSGPPKGQ